MRRAGVGCPRGPFSRSRRTPSTRSSRRSRAECRDQRSPPAPSRAPRARRHRDRAGRRRVRGSGAGIARGSRPGGHRRAAGRAAVTPQPSPAPSPSPAPAPPSPLTPLPAPTRRPTRPCAPAPAPPLHIPRSGVPIVYYHRVESVPPDFGSWGSKRKRTFLAYDSLPTAFEAQLDWLQAHGYTTILPRDLAAHWDHGARAAAAAGDPGLRRRVEDLAAQGAAGAQGPRHGRRVLPHARRDQARQPHLGAGPAARRAGNGIGAHDVHHVQLAGVPHRKPASRKRMFREVDGARRRSSSTSGSRPTRWPTSGAGSTDG